MFKKLFQPIDLTKGNIYKVIVLFMLPILLSYLLQQIYVLTDSIIVGQNLSVSEVNGLNDVGSITFIVLQFAFGCSSGFSVVSSNKIGNNDLEGVRKSFFSQFVLCVGISIILTILSILLLDPLLSLIGLNSSTGGLTYISARTYLFYLFLGIICQVLYNQICSLLLSIGDSLTPLIFLGFSTFLNVGLDLLLIVVFKMGVAGAAIATITAQGVSAILCYIYSFIKYPYLRFKKEDLRIPMKSYLEHLKYGLPLAFQFSILAFGLTTMQATIVKFDTTLDGTVIDHGPAQLAFGAVNKIQCFLMCPFNALCTAMLSFTGQNKGARDFIRIRKGVKAAFVIMLAIYAFALAVSMLLLIDNLFLRIFYAESSITEKAIYFGRLNIFVAFPFYLFLGGLFVLRGVLQGMQKPLYPFLAGIAELIGRIVICLFGPYIFVSQISTSLNLFEEPAPIIMAYFADPFAWGLGFFILAIGYFVSIKSLKKEINN